MLEYLVSLFGTGLHLVGMTITVAGACFFALALLSRQPMGFAQALVLIIVGTWIASLGGA